MIIAVATEQAEVGTAMCPQRKAVFSLTAVLSSAIKSSAPWKDVSDTEMAEVPSPKESKSF